jgi:hypothetical protein
MRCATSRKLFAFSLLFAVVLVSYPAIAAAGNACPTILPADVKAISEPRLCRVGAKSDGFSVCREYSNDRYIYQLVFRGGTSPKVVYELTRTGRHTSETVQESTRRNIGKRECSMERPSPVPAGAIYRGTGVCDDEQGRPLPCSLFEHTGARVPEAMRYFVFYEPDGSGVRHIDAQSAGRNEHALEAELAFQLGQALSKDVCCSNFAKSYLAHAATLFPDDDTYRAAMIAALVNDSKVHSVLMASFVRMLE